MHHYLILRESNIVPVNDWLRDHPDLDIRGGGNNTFLTVKLALLTDPTDASIVRARAANWDMPPDWIQEVLDEYGRSNFKVNITQPNWDASIYPRDVWPDVNAILADVTLKPDVFQLVPLDEE